jgi:hypothetical protein
MGPRFVAGRKETLGRAHHKRHRHPLFRGQKSEGRVGRFALSSLLHTDRHPPPVQCSAGEAIILLARSTRMHPRLSLHAARCTHTVPAHGCY